MSEAKPKLSPLEEWAGKSKTFVNDTGDTNEEDLIQGALHLLTQAEARYFEIKDQCEEQNDQASLEYMHGAQDLLKVLQEYCHKPKQLCGKEGAKS